MVIVSGAGEGSPSLPEVAAEEVEVSGVYDPIAVEVGSQVVAAAEGCSQDAEVGGVHDVGVAGIPCPHHAHFNAAGAAGHSEGTGAGEVELPLDAPVVGAIGQSCGKCEASACIGSHAVALRRPTHAKGEGCSYAVVARVGLRDTLPRHMPDDHPCRCGCRCGRAGWGVSRDGCCCAGWSTGWCLCGGRRG